MLVTYIDNMGDELTTVNAARVSFDKRSNYISLQDALLEQEVVRRKAKKTAVDLAYLSYVDDMRKAERHDDSYLSYADFKLISYLAKHKHMGCFEHQTLTVKMKVPIFIARQIQRHRTFSYNEVSRRYVDNEPEFYWPDKWRKRADNVKQGSSDEVVTEIGPWVSIADPLAQRAIPMKNVERLITDHALHMYNELLKGGVAPELARMILPQNMYTEFFMTGSLRNWIHFIKLRVDDHAQREVQVVGKQVLDIVSDIWPVSTAALMSTDL